MSNERKIPEYHNASYAKVVFVGCQTSLHSLYPHHPFVIPEEKVSREIPEGSSGSDIIRVYRNYSPHTFAGEEDKNSISIYFNKTKKLFLSLEEYLPFQWNYFYFNKSKKIDGKFNFTTAIENSKRVDIANDEHLPVFGWNSYPDAYFIDDFTIPLSIDDYPLGSNHNKSVALEEFLSDISNYYFAVISDVFLPYSPMTSPPANLDQQMLYIKNLYSKPIDSTLVESQLVTDLYYTSKNNGELVVSYDITTNWNASIPHDLETIEKIATTYPIGETYTQRLSEPIFLFKDYGFFGKALKKYIFSSRNNPLVFRSDRNYYYVSDFPVNIFRQNKPMDIPSEGNSLYNKVFSIKGKLKTIPGCTGWLSTTPTDRKELLSNKYNYRSGSFDGLVNFVTGLKESPANDIVSSFYTLSLSNGGWYNRVVSWYGNSKSRTGFLTTSLSAIYGYENFSAGGWFSVPYYTIIGYNWNVDYNTDIITGDKIENKEEWNYTKKMGDFEYPIAIKTQKDQYLIVNGNANGIANLIENTGYWTAGRNFYFDSLMITQTIKSKDVITSSVRIGPINHDNKYIVDIDFDYSYSIEYIKNRAGTTVQPLGLFSFYKSGLNTADRNSLISSYQSNQSYYNKYGLTDPNTQDFYVKEDPTLTSGTFTIRKFDLFILREEILYEKKLKKEAVLRVEDNSDVKFEVNLDLDITPKWVAASGDQYKTILQWDAIKVGADPLVIVDQEIFNNQKREIFNFLLDDYTPTLWFFGKSMNIYANYLREDTFYYFYKKKWYIVLLKENLSFVSWIQDVRTLDENGIPVIKEETFYYPYTPPDPDEYEWETFTSLGLTSIPYQCQVKDNDTDNIMVSKGNHFAILLLYIKRTVIPDDKGFLVFFDDELKKFAMIKPDISIIDSDYLTLNVTFDQKVIYRTWPDFKPLKSKAEDGKLTGLRFYGDIPKSFRRAVGNG